MMVVEAIDKKDEKKIEYVGIVKVCGMRDGFYTCNGFKWFRSIDEVINWIEKKNSNPDIYDETSNEYGVLMVVTWESGEHPDWKRRVKKCLEERGMVLVNLCEEVIVEVIRTGFGDINDVIQKQG